jgi:hypothetical protein
MEINLYLEDIVKKQEGEKEHRENKSGSSVKELIDSIGIFKGIKNIAIDNLIKDDKNANDNVFNSVINIDDLYVCCLCGIEAHNHSSARHKFVKIRDEYKCVRCQKYFFQHDHIKKPCFRPKKYIV